MNTFSEHIEKLHTFIMGNPDMGIPSEFEFLNDWYYSSILFLVFIGILILFLVNSHAKKSLMLHLQGMALTMLICGFILYFIGYNAAGSAENVLVLSLRSFTSAIEMFASKSSLNAVDSVFRNNPLYMVCFTIVHFLAICTSAVFIIKLFGYRLNSWLHCLVLSARCKMNRVPKNKQLFIFHGSNENSLQLAENIRTALGDDAILIFIDVPDSNRTSQSNLKFSIPKLLHLSGSSVDGFIDRIEAIKAIIINSNYRPTASMLKNVSSRLEFYDNLGIPRLGNIVEGFSKRQRVNFFFLSDSENTNIETVLVLKELYRLISANTGEKGNRYNHNIHLYCHGRKNTFNLNLLNRNAFGVQTHIIDSSSLSVLQLKKSVVHHPISFVDKNCQLGCVKSDFHALLVGFGETGKDAFRFLYEFSSFSDEQMHATGKHFYIVDQHLEKEKANFLNDAPALKHNDNIHWWEVTTHSTEFAEYLEAIINKLNYIVISVDNDLEAKELTGQIFDLAYRCRENLDKFRIYVRIKEQKYSDQILEYSRLADASWNQLNTIHIFGQNKSIFNYQVLTTDVIESNAKQFYYNYLKAANTIEENESQRKYVETKLLTLSPERLWIHRQQYLDPRENEEGKCICKPRTTFEDYIQLMYQQEQDKSNVWHILTKQALLGQDCESNKDMVRAQFINNLFAKDANNQYCNALTGTNKRILDYLSHTEHLRWTAKMELSGFTPGKKNFKKRQHHCMVDWQELNEHYAYTIVYDQLVVELSFRLLLNSK